MLVTVVLNSNLKKLLGRVWWVVLEMPFLLVSGILLTCKKGALDSNDKLKYVDKEKFVLLSVFDENKSWYLDENLYRNELSPFSVDKEDADFQESNLMHSINGLFYGNLQGLDVCVGEKVAWYMAVLGNEVDMHTG